MTSREPRIVVVGSVAMDLVVRVPRLPRPGETILGTDLMRAAGGKGANQAVAASRLGARAALVGRIGRDDFGGVLLETLRSEGVDLAHLLVDDEAPTGVAMIAVSEEDGENSIVTAAGANARVTAAQIDAAQSAVASASVLICSLEAPLNAVEAAVNLASAHGVPVVLNPAPAMSLPPGIIERCAVITPNRLEAPKVAGLPGSQPVNAARRLVVLGARCVVVTLGPSGALAVTARETISDAAVYAGPVVDTTAAGDCFTAAIAVGLAEDMALDRMLRFANAAAGLCVTKPGAQPSLPTRAEVESLARP